MGIVCMAEADVVLKNKNGVLIRFVLLTFIIILTFIAYKGLQLDELSSLENVGAFINDIRAYSQAKGWLGVMIFLLGGVVVIVLNVPTAIVIGIASALYGVVGAMALGFVLLNVATTCIYFIGQRLGRDFIFSIFGRSIERLEKQFLNRGMITVIHLRILFFALPPMNWFLSVMNLSYRDYFWGTLLGGIPQTLLYAWAGGVVFNALADGATDLSEFAYQIYIPLVVSISLSIGLKLVDHVFFANKSLE